ncbi:MAG: ATP-binding cassette domain-containing protein, partial [Casimicrobium sp.]
MSDSNFRATVIRAEGISKRYESGEASTDVLHELSIDVHEGETVAILGASGSGKSTLLHLLGGLDVPTAGRVTLLRSELAAISE